MSDHDRLTQLERALAENQEAIMGQLEDIRDQEAAAIAAIGQELADLHAQIAADAGNAPKPETVAALKALADKLTAMAPPAPPAPAPSPAPAPEPPPAPPAPAAA